MFKPKKRRKPFNQQPMFDPGLVRRLSQAAHKRCLDQALTAVEVAQGDVSRVPDVPTTEQ